MAYRTKTTSRPKALPFDGPRHVIVGRRRLLYFAGCDYLRLSGHRAVVRAMASVLKVRPLGTGASRVTTGENQAYAKAERAIARFAGRPAAILVAAGYLAPIAALQAMRSLATHVLLDEAAHACVADGAKLSGLPVIRFAHGNVAKLRRAIGQLGRNARPVIACDGLRGTVGQFTPLASYLAELPLAGWLLVDDAHGFGTAGPDGRGTIAAKGLYDPRIIQTISLSKSLGLQGGAIIGSREVIDAIYRASPAFVGNTAPLLPLAEGTRAAIGVLSADAVRVRRLQRNASALHELLPWDLRISHSPLSPICAVFPADRRDAIHLKRLLLKSGIYPSWIRYLSGPRHGFFRFALSSEHKPGDIEALAGAIADWAKEAGK